MDTTTVRKTDSLARQVWVDARRRQTAGHHILQLIGTRGLTVRELGMSSEGCRFETGHD